MSDEVTLSVNGTSFAGWKEVKIGVGIERLARDFTLTVTRKWPGATDVPRRVKQGDLCELYIGKDKLLTGYVFATPIRYDDKTVSVGVKGRSKTADLVDCSAIYKTGQWLRAKIEKISADLVKPFDKIKIIAQASTGAAMPEHKINEGETVFESLDRMLTHRQLLAMDDADGNVVFIKVGAGGRATTSLEYGKNIKAANAPLDYKDVFKQYTVRGQRSAWGEDSGEAAYSSSFSVENKIIQRYRKLTISQSGQVDTQVCKDRAQFENAHRAAKALETTYTVQGWRQADGSLWLPNLIVKVVDPIIGFDGDMLIVEVAYLKNENGTTAEITVGPEQGYIPAPEAKTKADGWTGVKAAK